MLSVKRFLALIVVLLLFTSAAVQAQQNATITLTSGARVSGQLIDLGGGGYTVRVAGVERQISLPDVAVIDFAGWPMTDADWAAFKGTTQIVMRNGQTVEGELYDILGSMPLKLTVRTVEGTCEFSAADVSRIVLARITAPLITARADRRR